MRHDQVPNDPEIPMDHLGASSITNSDEVSTLMPPNRPLNGKKWRPFYFLIIPFLLVLGILALLVAMIVWLVTSHREPFEAPVSLTRGALIVDEASRWCKIQKKVVRSVACGSGLEPSLLGLTLSGLLVCTLITERLELHLINSQGQGHWL
jgi:hypothetical protein